MKRKKSNHLSDFNKMALGARENRNLIHSLYRTSLACQRSKTIRAVFEVIGRQFEKLGLGTTIYFLDKNKKIFTFKYTTLTSHTPAELFKKFAKDEITGFAFPLEEVEDYRKLMDSGKGRLFKGRSQRRLLRNIFLTVPAFRGEKQGTLISPVLKFIKRAVEKEKICTISIPLIVGGEKIGLFESYAQRFSEKDVPTFTVFAHQISNTLRRLKINRQITALNKKLERRVNQQTKQLLEALRSKSQFIAGVSHGLRTSLSILQANWDLFNLLAEKNGHRSSSDQEEISVSIKEQINNLVHLIDELTMLASQDSEVYKLKMAKLNLGELVRYELEKMKILAKERGIKIRGKLPGGVEIMGDEKMLKKMINNLLSNAIEYGKDKGRVVVELDKGKAWIKLKVIDNGLGIPKEDLARIFDYFYRVDKTGSRATSGTGLGLTICRWIAEAHQGKIKVKSKLGQGSRFTVYLPLINN